MTPFCSQPQVVIWDTAGFATSAWFSFSTRRGCRLVLPRNSTSLPHKCLCPVHPVIMQTVYSTLLLLNLNTEHLWCLVTIRQKKNQHVLDVTNSGFLGDSHVCAPQIKLWPPPLLTFFAFWKYVVQHTFSNKSTTHPWCQMVYLLHLGAPSRFVTKPRFLTTLTFEWACIAGDSMRVSNLAQCSFPSLGPTPIFGAPSTS